MAAEEEAMLPFIVMQTEWLPIKYISSISKAQHILKKKTLYKARQVFQKFSGNAEGFYGSAGKEPWRPPGLK